jgi:hypothetical protein
MKAKTHRPSHKANNHRDQPLPHELGVHLFALIKRNLLARRERRPSPAAASQLTFAF